MITPKVITRLELKTLPHKVLYDGRFIQLSTGDFYYLNEAIDAYCWTSADDLGDALTHSINSMPADLSSN